MSYFNIVAETNENTVVTTYEPLPKRPEAYQSEAALEREFIKLLTARNCRTVCLSRTTTTRTNPIR
jgi:type I restriction enzyme R subunit